MKRLLPAFIIYVALSIFIFGKLPQTFFQQDEWAILGNMIYADKAGISLFDRLFIYEQDTHLIPLSNAVTLALYRLFGITFAPWAVISILLHLVNAFLVLVLAEKLVRNRLVAFGAGVIFLVSSISHQAVTWLATTVGTAGSTLFFLLSLLTFATYLEEEKQRTWQLLLTAFFFLVSLGFKETSIFGFLLFPIWWMIIGGRKTFKKSIAPLMVFGCIAIGYFFMRIFFTAIAPPSVVLPELTQAPLEEYIVRAVAIPLRALAQSVFPLKFMLLFSRELIQLAYPQFFIGGAPDPYVVEGVAADIISLVVSIFVFLFCFVAAQIFISKKRSEGVRVITITLISIAASSLPFIAVPGKAGYNALLDGRHLYLTGIFSSILVATVLWGILLWIGKRRIAAAGILGLFLLAMSYHGLKIRRDIDYQVAIGGLRKSILNKVITLYPTLPKRVVFFVQSDAPYYGLPFEEPIIPFQSGFGQTLLVWYNAHEANLPACFFDKKYLYVLLSEDFKECKGQGFGYFRKKETFNQAIKIHAIKPEEVIAFRFTSSTNTLTDFTIQVRETLRQFGKL
ncbi:MAG: hypothetical protein HZA36_02700 [Parcubacteria group bacterium]|nr:hypothetical protein [Parcubacteria group bacterium]